MQKITQDIVSQVKKLAKTMTKSEVMEKVGIKATSYYAILRGEYDFLKKESTTVKTTKATPTKTKEVTLSTIDKTIFNMTKQGKKQEEIASKIGKSRKFVYRRMNELLPQIVTKDVKSSLSKEQRKAVTLLKNGATHTQIAMVLCKSRKYVTDMLRSIVTN